MKSPHRAKSLAILLLTGTTFSLLVGAAPRATAKEKAASPSTSPAIQTSLQLPAIAPGPCTEPVCTAAQTAFTLEKSGNFDQAAAQFLKAAALPSDLSDILHVHAAASALKGSPQPDFLQKIIDSKALEKGYEGSEFLLAKIEVAQQSIDKQKNALPNPKTIENALKSSQNQEVCDWFVPLLSTAKTTPENSKSLNTLADHAFAYCVDDFLAKAVQKLAKKPSDLARLRRAEGFFSRVRFRDANQQIEALNASKLSRADRCTLAFLSARTLMRLRRIENSNKNYQQVIDTCTEKAHEGDRVRSMYALGRYHHDKNQLDQSQKMFEAILAEYPKLSHADDALFYLARVERKRGNTQKERELLTRALREYPDGDMTHEMAWEVYESLLRTKKYKEFIDAVSKLELPARDDQYFSQGRLPYFLALANFRLDNKQQAYDFWQKTWTQYPFSFYGYISSLRLRENNIQPTPLKPGARANQVTWFNDANWKATGAYKLASLGQYHAACDFESVRLRAIQTTTKADDETNKWRLAYLCHAAERYPLSHNIVRRQIPGSPWAHPDDGILIRWQLAWPNPFAAKIQAAHTAEAAQWDGPTVHRAFSTSIMREESSFIEDVTSWAGALGLMQLMPKTALDHDKDIEGRATPERLKTADVNIRVGVDHIYSLARRFDSHPVLMAAAYNAGGGRISGWLRNQPNDDIALWVEDIPYLETRDYTKRVIGSYAAYQWLLGQTELDTRPANPARL